MEENRLTFREWVIVFAALATATGVSRVAGLSAKWEHATEYTVFVALIIALRPAWRKPFFGRGLAVALLLHVIAVILATQALPSDSRGIRGIPAILIGMVEGLFIASLLWRVTHPRG